MFTGIVEELGEVLALDRAHDSARITIRGPLVATGARHGQSIAVNGCCLTVVSQGRDEFTADVMAETLDRTSLGALAPGSRVNLERSVTPLDRLDGHLVQGHVDGVGAIVSRAPAERWDVVTISAPGSLLRYVAIKGSIAVDGISLTVSGLSDDAGTFSVSLIPATLELTTLGSKAPGDPVNLEVDVVAKYVERLLTHHREDG
jgi:riboflavin synthase